MLGFKGSVILGLLLALFTIPLYRWFLGEFSIFVALPLGFAFGCIIHRYSVFYRNRDASHTHRRRNNRSRQNSSGQLHVDRYGRVNDPDD